MRLYPSTPYPSTLDTWGFPLVWVPFGKAGAVNHGSFIKEILYDDLFKSESLDTLAGINVYYFHPGAVNPDNVKDYYSVGITTDVYRVTDDNRGGEVLVRIQDADTYQQICEGIITESSPGYTEVNGYRDYNHIAIVPAGYSKGGAKMKIQLEALESHEVYSGISINFMETTQMDEQIGQLTAQNQMILDELTAVKAMLVADAVEDKMEDEIMLEADEIEKKIYQEGYEAGIQDGETLIQARGHGYEGNEPVDAKRFVVDRAFPTISLEAKSPDFINGIFPGALASLSRKEGPVKEPATTIVQEAKEKKSAPSRIPNGQK